MENSFLGTLIDFWMMKTRFVLNWRLILFREALSQSVSPHRDNLTGKSKITRTIFNVVVSNLSYTFQYKSFQTRILP